MDKVTVPPDFVHELNDKVNKITTEKKKVDLSEKYKSVGSRVRSIRKKTDQILRRGGTSSPAIAIEDNTFEGVTGKLSINKNPL